MASSDSIHDELDKNKFSENGTNSLSGMAGGSSHNEGERQLKSKASNLKGAVFITSLAGASLLFGFGATVAMAKKKDPTMFAKTLIPSREIPETGHSFAGRALAWGTLYSVSGFSLFCFGVWKMLGVHSFFTKIPETGHSFAGRALAWGTLYSVSGFSLFCFGVWKMLGVHSLVEFRDKMQSLFPNKLSKKSTQNEQTNFANLTDLMQYIIDLDGEEKRKKQSLKSNFGAGITEN